MFQATPYIVANVTPFAAVLSHSLSLALGKCIDTTTSHAPMPTTVDNSIQGAHPIAFIQSVTMASNQALHLTSLASFQPQFTNSNKMATSTVVIHHGSLLNSTPLICSDKISSSSNSFSQLSSSFDYLCNSLLPLDQPAYEIHQSISLVCLMCICGSSIIFSSFAPPSWTFVPQICTSTQNGIL